MKRVLVAHPTLDPTGGGSVVAAWTLEALKRDYDVTLATLRPVDFAAVNANFGTTLRAEDLHVRIAPPAFEHARKLLPTQGALLRWCLAMRWAQDVDRAGHYDVIIGTENQMDFQRRGMHYVHHPQGFDPRHTESFRWFHRLPAALTGYNTLCRMIARGTQAGLRRNLSLANSEFIAERTRKMHGVASTILHPPVPGEFPQTPWEERVLGIVCVGRMHTDKRWEWAVEAVDHLRASGHALELTLISHRCDDTYQARLSELARSRPGFRILSDLSRDELVREVARHRYGMHAMEYEHFGIAPAEIQRAGCLTFVHETGGPVEIVGHESRLTFATPQDAAEKIRRVLTDPALERELRAHVAKQRDRFSAERFSESLRELVEQFSRGEI